MRETTAAALAEERNILRQPIAVWATAFAAVIAFMGIGLVDPILPSLVSGLDASPSQVSLLFTSYFAITAVTMLVTGWVSDRIGSTWTLLLGLGTVVVFAALSGLSGSVLQLVGFRAGWGLGNALFIATALTVIVGAARGGRDSAITLYESALGLGISTGPLLGAALGGLHWRYPFFGTALLMALAFTLVAVLLKDNPRPAQRTRLTAPLRALRHGGLATTAASAFLYSYGFFTVVAFTPFVLGMSARGIGLVFFGWGIALAAGSVLLAPLARARFEPAAVLPWSMGIFTVVLVALAAAPSQALLVALVVVAGLAIGVNNTVFTESAMAVSEHPRAVASAGYNLVRWLGAALATYISGILGEHVDERLPFLVAAGLTAAGVVVLRVRRRHLVVLAVPAVPGARQLAHSR
jgi:ACDE family multidrug resistance protein